MRESTDCAACAEAEIARSLSRRSFLRRAAGVTAAAFAGLVAPQLTTRVAFAADAPAYTGDVLVVLSLRGGFDGMSAIVPLGDPHYRAARPTIAVPESKALPTADRFWGLHPSLAPLKPWWDAGTFGAIHAVGSPDPTRSHFSATAAMERAAPGSSLRTGWVDRALGLRPSSTVFQGVSAGSLVPPSMAGPFPELGFSSIDDLKLDGVWGDTPEKLASDAARWAAALTALHAHIPSLSEATTSALGAVDTARALKAAGRTPANGAVYPHTVDGGPYEGSPLSAALADVARLVRAKVGLQLVCLDYGEWDMHENLGTVGSGRFQSRLAEWSTSVAAFLTDLGPAGMADVTIMTLSEFGRRVAENGDHGLDHGHGNAMLLLGGGVVGGTVHGRWPGLASEQLDDGDLAGTTDYRDVLAEALTRRCHQPAADLAGIFPNRGAFTAVEAFAQKP